MRLRKLHLATDEDWQRELARIGADPETWDRLSLKCRVVVFSTGYLPATAANILKQCMLSGGADAIVSRGSVSCRVKDTAAMIIGTPRQILRGCTSLFGQPFDLPALAGELRNALDDFPVLPETIPARNKVLDFREKPLIMGILNVTPDSFFDGGRYLNTDDALIHARQMVSQGADIIDIGAESTRPGSSSVPVDVQLDRLLPIIESLHSDCEAVISVDTASASVARAVLSAGAEAINDVSALSDPTMAQTVAEAGVPLVLMHMKGTPQNMQDNPEYFDVIEEIYSFLEERIEVAMEAGIRKEHIIIDPGIGFGKRLKDNLRIISRLEEFRWLGCRVLLGHSMKSFIGQLIRSECIAEREIGSHAVTALSSSSADIVRVHDVAGTFQVFQITRALKYLASD
ncbi:MAG: dihydropteroate synthase [Candidatus Fermentibacteraceae bacterium]|nr:dihydropteroate synthase [Candidatus Fermentibacteraceae bacterium]